MVILFLHFLKLLIYFDKALHKKLISQKTAEVNEKKCKMNNYKFFRKHKKIETIQPILKKKERLTKVRLTSKKYYIIY